MFVPGYVGRSDQAILQDMVTLGATRSPMCPDTCLHFRAATTMNKCQKALKVGDASRGIPARGITAFGVGAVESLQFGIPVQARIAESYIIYKTTSALDCQCGNAPHFFDLV